MLQQTVLKGYQKTRGGQTKLRKSENSLALPGIAQTQISYDANPQICITNPQIVNSQVLQNTVQLCLKTVLKVVFLLDFFYLYTHFNQSTIFVRRKLCRYCICGLVSSKYEYLGFPENRIESTNDAYSLSFISNFSEEVLFRRF